VKPAPEHDESVHGPVHVTRSPTAVLADDHFTAAELALVSALVAAAPVLDPSALARARMQVRVLAGAGIVDAAARGSDGVVVDLGRRPSRTVRTPLGMRARFLVAAAAALCLVVALSGISLLLSRDALPGDALYSLKRAGENTRLELTFGDTDRGLRHLDYASRRVDEVVALLERGSGPIDSAITLGLIQAFDAQTIAGSTRLTSSGVAGDATTLKSLFSWAQGQSSRLVALRPQLSTTTAQRLDAAHAGAGAGRGVEQPPQLQPHHLGCAGPAGPAARGRLRGTIGPRSGQRPGDAHRRPRPGHRTGGGRAIPWLGAEHIDPAGTGHCDPHHQRCARAGPCRRACTRPWWHARSRPRWHARAGPWGAHARHERPRWRWLGDRADSACRHRGPTRDLPPGAPTPRHPRPDPARAAPRHRRGPTSGLRCAGGG